MKKSRKCWAAAQRWLISCPGFLCFTHKKTFCYWRGVQEHTHKGMRRKDGCFKRENSLFGVRSENNSSRIIKMSCWVIGHAWPSFSAQNETGIFTLRMTDADAVEKKRLCMERRMHSTCFLSETFIQKNHLKAHMTFPVFV